jgi:hypothetical protein
VSVSLVGCSIFVSGFPILCVGIDLQVAADARLPNVIHRLLESGLGDPDLAYRKTPKALQLASRTSIYPDALPVCALTLAIMRCVCTRSVDPVVVLCSLGTLATTFFTGLSFDAWFERFLCWPIASPSTGQTCPTCPSRFGCTF